METREWSGDIGGAEEQPADQRAPTRPTETGVIRRKADMVDKIIEKSRGRLNEETASIAYKAFTDAIIDFLEQDETVQISGFGKFFNRVRASRMSINPETKQSIVVPEKRVPIFKSGKNLKEASALRFNK